MRLRTSTPDILAWARLLGQTRRFFDDRGFVEVWTPQLVSAGAFEAVIDPLRVAPASLEELHTSPEIEMKAILAQMAQPPRPIYQICKVFRDDPETEIHSKEFTMLEWYQPNATIEELKALTKTYLSSISATPLKFEEISISQKLLEKTGIDIGRQNTTRALRNQIEKMGTLSLSTEEDWQSMYFKLFIEKLEPELSRDKVTILSGFPALVSPLSEIGKDGFASRFEVYAKGMELGNGCTELRDVEELKRRYDQQSAHRIREGKKPHPLPEKLFEAAKTMPPCSGIAIGLDRLFSTLYSS